jgi:ribosome biogenesis GTPase
LVELESGGFVVDTPGFSSYELIDIPHEELELYYPEFEGYLNTCRFTRCSHISEPSCTVKEAVDKGDISKDRYLRYAQFYNTLKKQEDLKYKK